MVQISLNPYRCTNCGKLLGYFVMTLGAQIKCPRCKLVNTDDVTATVEAQSVTLTDVPPTDVLTNTPFDVEVLKE